MSYEYPTEEQLEKIKEWDLQNVKGLVDYIKSLWWYPERQFRLYKSKNQFRKNILKLALHTGGWSGNESIISALEQSDFWLLFWEKSTRGGHYWFEIEPNRFK